MDVALVAAGSSNLRLRQIGAAALDLPEPARRELIFGLLWSLPRTEVVQLNQQLSFALKKDIVGLLPQEVALSILSNLELEDLLQCAVVSQGWAKLCNNQALWLSLCAGHRPPIRPAQATWADVTQRRQQMHRPASDPEDILCDPDDSIDSQGDTSGGRRVSSLGSTRHVTAAGLRRNVWERNGSGLPTHWQKSVQEDREIRPTSTTRLIPIDSHLPVPFATPGVNYKHLYIVHHVLSQRMRPPALYFNPSPDSANATRKAFHPKPKTVDGISSMESGGLPGHMEAIYSLELFRHRMSIHLPVPCSECRQSRSENHQGHSGYSAVLASLSSSVSPIPGKDWLLSGSRDKTLRLWQIESDKPRVVKVFQGGHQGSVLSHFVAKLSVKDPHTSHPSSSPSKKREDYTLKDGKTARQRVVAISGGSDGRICLWDIAEGDGTPEKIIEAHRAAVLCVRGDDEHVVSCSKDKTIRLFDIHTLDQKLVIGDKGPRVSYTEYPISVNVVDLTKEYIISASGDRSIRVWSIKDGSLLACVESAHSRGIASLAVDLSPSCFDMPYVPGTQRLATIITGSSDASVSAFSLLSLPPAVEDEVNLPIRDLSIDDEEGTEESEGTGSERTDSEGDVRMSLSPANDGSHLVLRRAFNCMAPCICRRDLGRRPRCICLKRGHTGLVRSISLGDGIFVSGSYDATVKIWDRDSGKLLGDLSGPRTGRVFSVVHDKTRIISAGLDCTINIWDFSQGLDTTFV